MAVSLVSRHSPVVAERVSTSRFTRMIARMWPSHSVSAKLPPGANTSTVRASSRHRRFLSAVGGAIEGCCGVAQCGDRVMQGGLVGFDLGDQMNAGGGGLLECFFDNAWHRQRKRGEHVWTAGISLDFSS